MDTKHAPAPAVAAGEIPRGTPANLPKYLKYDIVSGFLVFLIALPLCLGISLASGYPPIAGIFTAIVGSILTTLLSNSELTIKGPAAGLIVIVLGAVMSFGNALLPEQAARPEQPATAAASGAAETKTPGEEKASAEPREYVIGKDLALDARVYRMALAVGVVAGIIQIIFGLVRAGALGDFFPTSVVHGMLAAIGVIIMLKQLPVTLGLKAEAEPFEIIRHLPEKFIHANPEIAIIGGVSLLIMFTLPFIKNKYVKMVPAQMVVLVVAVVLGMLLNLDETHTYTMFGQKYELSEKYLVNVPNNMLQAVAFPDFSVFTNPRTMGSAIQWTIMFALIGSLESMLSAKAIDMIDPWKRKTNLNRDMMAVGIANTVVACIGGLPMISEIVRSRANIDNGARTRFSDLYHGLFLLLFVALAPWLIHKVPLAALAAMLVYTGFRLASPKEFYNVYKIGIEQLIIFASTVIGVLATDLLIGIGIGIVVKLMIHMLNGVPLRSMFMPFLDVETRGKNEVVIFARDSAVFSNWLGFKRQITQLGLVQKNNVTVDLSGAKFVDHSVMEKLHEMEMDFEQAGLKFNVVGMEIHQPLSQHPHSARKRALAHLRRVTVVADQSLEEELTNKFASLGVSGYTSIPCYGAGRRTLADGGTARNSQVRIEVVAPATLAESILNYLYQEVQPKHAVTACLEAVEVLRRDQF